MSHSNRRNSLLAQLSGPDLAALTEHLEPIDLPKDYQLASPNQPISHHYFLDSGVGSLVAVSPAGKKAEVGLVGREGITPVAAILSCETISCESMIQIAGHGRRVESRALAKI